MDAGRNYNPLQFSILSLPPATGGSITSISGRTGELWAATDNGHVFRRADAGFAEVPGFTGNWVDVYVAPDNAVFLASSGTTIRWCLSNCTSQAAFSSYTVVVASTDLDAVCGTSSSNVYAVANRDSSIGILFHWDGSSWTMVSNNLGLTVPRACWARPDGAVFIVGTRDVVMWDQGAAMVETASLDFSAFGIDALSQLWSGVHGLGDTVVAVGYKRRALVRKGPGANWSIIANPVGASNTFNTVALAWPDELYAGGSVATKLLHVSDGGIFNPAAVDLPALTYLNRIHVLTPDELYFGGRDNNGPVIVRAKR